MQKKKDEKKQQFIAKFEGQPQGKLNLAAHAYDNAGNHIESAEINEAGNFMLALTKSELKKARLFIAPVGDKKEVPSITELEKLNAYQPYLDKRHLGRDVIELLPIPELNYKWWWWCKCRVTGKVTKKVFVGGAWQILPVCNARVHICEIDRWPIIIKKLPDDLIFRIRDEYLAIKWPIPPIPDPGPLRKFSPAFSVERFELKTRERAAVTKTAAGNPAEFSFAQNSFKAQIASGNSAFHLRQELTENFHLIFPYFCYWKWIWPYFYHCDEKAVIETDEQGRFDKTISYFCFGDKPDIYVWVEYFINGQWVTVYNPGRACHTYWNYTCGTEINITITDDRVPHCGRTEVVGEIAEILRIGNASNTSHILQRNISQTVQGVSFNAKGLTDFYFFGIGGVKYLNPFGEFLDVWADFGSTLHTSGVTHFRCSYKLNSVADIPANWTVLDNPIGRYYQDEINDGVNPPFQQNKIFDLKDPSYSGLYIIPNDEASLQAGIPVPAGLQNRVWMREDFVIASIDSTSLANDLYDFKFELFRIVANVPERVSVPKSTFQVPNPDDVMMSLPLSNSGFVSVNFPDFHTSDYLIEDPADVNKALAFKMTFRVDNNLCNAVIDNITVINANGTTTDSDTECGFAPYLNKNTSDVEFSFEASHPNNFAVFTFEVIRGNNNPCPDANTSGMVIGSSSNGYTLAGGKFSKEVAVANLLGANCTQGAFSENLDVYPLATNGSRILYEYKDVYVAAFALEHGGGGA